MKNFISNEEADEIGDGYAQLIYQRSPNDSLCVDVDGLATEVLGLTIVYESFFGRDIDKDGFLADGDKDLCITRDGHEMSVVFPWKTVVLDKELLKPEKSGRRRFTLAHEVSHYLITTLFLKSFSACAHREYDGERQYSYKDLKEILSAKEMHADRLAAAILMPRFNMDKAMRKYAEKSKFCIYGCNIILPEDKMRMQLMADNLGVSFQALKIRLKELGFIEKKTFTDFVKQDYREGDFDDSDIEYDRSQGQLSPEQAYLIHRSKRESEALEQKTILCPVCGFQMTAISRNSSGYAKLKCSKCKLESPLGLAYYRKKK